MGGFETGQVSNFVPYNNFVPCMQAIVSQNWPKETAWLGSLFHDLGLVFKDGAQYSKALEMYQEALRIRKAVLGNDRPNTARTVNNTGSVYKSKGQYDKAMEMLAHQKGNFGK